MATTSYIWDVDTDSYLMETDESNVTQAVYTNEPVPFGNLVSQRSASTSSYLHFDALGSTRQLSDSSQTISDSFTYDAWGSTIFRNGTSSIPFTWVGKHGYQSNSENDTVYIRRRTFQPAFARWMSIDPIRLVESHNLYSYASNNPILATDPSGMILVIAGDSDKADALVQLNTLCPEADLILRRLPKPDDGWQVDLGGASLCCTPSQWKHKVSCECICELVADQARTITLHIIPMSGIRDDRIVIPNNPVFADGVNGPCSSRDKVSGPDVGPFTGGNFDSVTSPSKSSKWKFGAFLVDGSSFAFRANYLVLGHELCGHAWKRLGAGGVKWNRPPHDPTITIENQIAKEHGDNNERGLFKDRLGCGESAAYLPEKKIWHWPDACLPKGLHYPAQ